MILQACEYCGNAAANFTSAYEQFNGQWVLAANQNQRNSDLIWACKGCAETHVLSLGDIYVSSEPYPGAWRDAELQAYNYGLDDY